VKAATDKRQSLCHLKVPVEVRKCKGNSTKDGTGEEESRKVSDKKSETQGKDE